MVSGDNPKTALRLFGLLAVAAFLFLGILSANAEIVKYSKFWTNVGSNTATWLQTQGGDEVQIAFKPNGVQDGTITVYACPAEDATTCTSVGTIAGGVSTATTFVGTSSAFIYVTLTGNTPVTGSINAYVTVKN